jgi:hypothetical protein
MLLLTGFAQHLLVPFVLSFGSLMTLGYCIISDILIHIHSLFRIYYNSTLILTCPTMFVSHSRLVVLLS